MIVFQQLAWLQLEYICKDGSRARNHVEIEVVENSLGIDSGLHCGVREYMNCLGAENQDLTGHRISQGSNTNTIHGKQSLFSGLVKDGQGKIAGEMFK